MASQAAAVVPVAAHTALARALGPDPDLAVVVAREAGLGQAAIRLLRNLLLGAVAEVAVAPGRVADQVRALARLQAQDPDRARAHQKNRALVQARPQLKQTRLQGARTKTTKAVFSRLSRPVSSLAR